MDFGISGVSTTAVDASSMLKGFKSEIANKLKNGENEVSIQLGGRAYTQTEWKKVLDNFDKAEKTLQEESQAQAEQHKQALEHAKKVNETIQEAYLMQKSTIGTTRVGMFEALENRPTGCPYAGLSVDGQIEYNGVVFSCDFENNAISLGDVSDKNNNLYINLHDGGTLIVCKDNLEDLKSAIGMFSAEDQGIILKAIAADKYETSRKMEMEQEEADTVENLK